MLFGATEKKGTLKVTFWQGCQIFLVQTYQNGKSIPNYHKLHISNGHILILPNGCKIYPHFPFQCPPKYTQIGIFGLKTNHLATLLFGSGQRKEVCLGFQFVSFLVEEK
jgi:hypothetical protein